MKVANNTFVTLTYTLHNDTKDGPVIDQATNEKPLNAIFGHGMFLPRFEECLQGLEPGEKYGFHLTPAEGYGEYNNDMLISAKPDMFMDENGNLSDLCKEGNTLQFNVGNGAIMPGKIKKVTADAVEIDFNHELAGVPLYFEGEIIAVRELREEDFGGGCGSCGGNCDSGCGGGCDSCK